MPKNSHGGRRLLNPDLQSIWNEAISRGLSPRGVLLVVDADRQRLFLLRNGAVEMEFTISTSADGLGNVRDSHKTPTGFHEVAERFGDGEPAGRVFKARKALEKIVPQAEWSDPAGPELITTRIMRLAGLEPGVNAGGVVDTFNRYVYLHGTNREHELGKPASRGCIRLGNGDMIDLYDRTANLMTWCWIGPAASGTSSSSASAVGDAAAQR